MPKRIIVILIGAYSLLMFFLKALDSNYRRHLPERIIIISIGACLLFMFFLMRSGRFRSWFIAKPVPGLMSGPMSYLSLNMGVIFISWPLITMLPNYNFNDQPYFSIFFLSWLGGPFLGFYWAANPPRWLQPRWVRWLSDEYGYCLHILVAEAQDMPCGNWESQTRQQQGLQKWIDAVYQRRKTEIDLNWLMFKYYAILEQQAEKGHDWIKHGLVLEGHIPEHRRDEALLTKEESDRIKRVERENLSQGLDSIHVGPDTKWD